MERRNAPSLILSWMWLRAALFSGQRRDGKAATATILGSVTDGSGAVIPEAALVIRNTGTG